MIFVSSLELIPSWLTPLRDRQRSKQPAISARHKVTIAVEASFQVHIGTCWSLSFPVDPPPLPAMFPSSAGLNPVDGITMRAQTILHREILHLHGLLILAISLLRTRFAILSPSFMDFVTSPIFRCKFEDLIRRFDRRFRPSIPVCTISRNSSLPLE